MKRTLLWAAAGLIVLAGTAAVLFAPAKAPKANPKMVWSDEFTENTLDPAKWTAITGDGCPTLCGFGNNELQYYTNNPENLSIENGQLVIRAQKQKMGKRQYTSAKLVTAHKAGWSAGRIDVRAKLPKGRGTWPAIWMLPTLDRPMNWPRDGEIDIMEHVGFNEGWVLGTIHTQKYNHMKGTHKSDSIYVPDASTAFHTYTLEWTDQSLTWLVDGQAYNTLERGNEGPDGWPFDGTFHLILNLAVGGNWGGKMGVDNAIFPQALVVDYVRVYEL